MEKPDLRHNNIVVYVQQQQQQQPFNGPLSVTTQASQYQKGNTNLKQETYIRGMTNWMHDRDMHRHAALSRKLSIKILRFNT